jgi:hypothetical protein
MRKLTFVNIDPVRHPFCSWALMGVSGYALSVQQDNRVVNGEEECYSVGIKMSFHML